MANTEQDVWVFRIVHQDTGKPAQGVPVTVLDKGGNAAGHWVSDADGIVAVPRRDILKLRLRAGGADRVWVDAQSHPQRGSDRARHGHARGRADAAGRA